MTNELPSKSKVRSPKRLFISLLVVIASFGLVGVVCYVVVWRGGDEKAQALSGLLAFIASVLSALATIFYVFLTNLALVETQESISLQQKQLDQAREAVELQRREWEQKVRVFPQFWLEADGTGNTAWYKRDPQYPAGNRIIPLQMRDGFNLRIWNYSEQSFLVESIHLQRADLAMVPNQHVLDLNLVVRPHSVEAVSVSSHIMRLLTQTVVMAPPDNVMEKDLDRQARIFVRLIFSDWSQKQALTEIREFEFIASAPNIGVTIRSPQKPSAIRPSI
jgi:hypothetical protein